MSDAHAVARDQLRAFIERIERLEEEKKTIADDIKDVYGEAKGVGFDTKVLRKLISIRKQDRDERAEQEAILDMYMIALGMVDEPAGYDEPRQSEPAERQPAMALRSDAGLNILTKHEDITTAPVTASEFQAKASGDNGATEQDIEDTADSVTGDASRSSRGDDSPATIPERATVATQGEATAPTSAEREDCASANAGGDHVDGNALRVPTSNTGEGAANTALPAKPKHRLRPNCLDRSNCKSGSVDHCWSCKKAIAEKSEVAA